MKTAIIGGGITGLTAAYELTRKGHAVTIFEKEPVLGGLAIGLKQQSWEWSLEKGYHHLFTNDTSILGLLKEIGLEDKIIIKRPITANYTPSGQIIQFDRPQDLLTYPGFSFVDKIRTAKLLAFLKLNPFWKPLEGLTAKQLLTFIGGKRAWKLLWEPLMIGKFDNLADTVAASWMWARIHKRTPSLVYIAGGFQTLVDALERIIKKTGGTIRTGTTIDGIRKTPNGDFLINGNSYQNVLLTVPTPLIEKLIPETAQYMKQARTIPHLHAQTLILETKEPILNNVYWLSILDRTFPFLAVVAHTNFMNPKHYSGHHLTYFGNYLPTGHKFLTMSKEQLLKEFLPYIKRLSQSSKLKARNSKLDIINSFSFVGPFAQPVHQLHYSQIAPKLETQVPNLYIANLDSIYPWDRGTNYAVELGQKAALAMLGR